MPKKSLFPTRKTEPTPVKETGEPKHLAPEDSSKKEKTGGGGDAAVKEVRELAGAMAEALKGLTSRIEKLDGQIKELAEKQASMSAIDTESIAKAAREAAQGASQETTEAAQAAIKAAQADQAALNKEVISLKREISSLTRQLALTPAEAKEKAEDVAIMGQLRTRSIGRKEALEERAKNAAALDALAD